MNNIVMSKVWEDVFCIESNVCCCSELISVQSNVYACNESIDELAEQIKRFLDGTDDETFWMTGERGNGSVNCMSWRFLYKDRLGHERIEVFMEINDEGDYDTHHCCFYIETENGLLAKFCDKLPRLKEPEFGIEIKLVDDDF